MEEAFKFFCAYHSVAPRTDLLERLGLSERRKDRFHELSTGQQRCLGRALVERLPINRFCRGLQEQVAFLYSL